MNLFALPLRALVVAPCPVHCAFPEHARVEAFYDALEAQGEQMAAEWLWPATLEALIRRLAAQALPAVGVIYLEAPVRQSDEGLALCFEDAEPRGMAGAGRLGELFAGHGVGVVILAASGGADTEVSEVPSFASVHATTSGAHVLSLGEQLGPRDAAQALTTFLGSLISGHAPGLALAEARRALEGSSFPMGPSGREQGGSLALHLTGADAPLVTVVPSAPTGVSKVVRFPGPGLIPAWKRLAEEPEAGGLPPEPEGGFVGRERELHTLESALWGQAGNGIVLLHGYEGMGKTALAAHAARWLVRTGRFAQVVYTDFSGGGYVDLALYDLGARLAGEGFGAQQADAVDTVERALVETPTLVIWDGFEALLPEGEQAPGAEALDELLKLGARVARAGQSRLCVISELPTIPDLAYAEGTLSLSLALNGLDEAAAIELLDSLRKTEDDHELSREQAVELVGALGGHPLALRILAPLCAERSCPEVMVQLEGILPGLAAGEGRLRNQGLSVALEALLRSFDEGLRPRILSLGAFRGGFMEPLGLRIIGLEEAAWGECKKRLASAGVLRDSRLPRIAVPYVFVSSALTRHLSRRLSAAEHGELEQHFTTGYFGLMNWATQGGSHLLAQLKLLARCELPNLRRGLCLLMAAQELDMLGDFSNLMQTVLEGLGLQKEHDAIADQVQTAILEVLNAEGPMSRSVVQFILSRSERLFAAGHIPELGSMLTNLSKRMEQEDGLAYGGDQATFDHAIALHRLGRCWQVVGRLDEAQGCYGRALELLGGATLTPDIRLALISIHSDLGGMFLASMRLDEAWDAYQKGLAVARELGHSYSMGKISAQLATIALAREQMEQARELCESALEYLKESEDYTGTAAVWNQLAAIAWHASDLAEARHCYQQTLELSKKANNVLLEAQARMQLAQVAEQAGDICAAEADYTQALRIYQEHNIRQAVVAAEMALASLFLDEGQTEKARIHAEAARATAEGSSPDVHPWKVYALLQRIAEAEKDQEMAAHWRTRVQEDFAASPESKPVLERWRPIIRGVAAACRGEALSGETVGLLEKLEAVEQWQKLAATIWRILDGERNAALCAELDHVDALIVQRILAVIEAPELENKREGPAPENEPTDDAGQAGLQG